MNPYNTKLILSCFKQVPNSIRTPEVTSQATEALVAPTAAIAMVIVETAHLLILHLWKKKIKNCISHLTITKGGARSTQLNKVLGEISPICQDHHYAYIFDIISSNTKPTQEYFLSDHLIKRRHTSEHYVKQRVVDPIIGLDVPSGSSLIDPEMVENTLIFNLNPQDQQRLGYNHESILKSQEYDKLIANKKSVMKIIHDLCNEETKAEIVINSSYKDNIKTGDLIKFLM